MAEASLTPIFNRLNQEQGYHPSVSDTFADWAMEAGDIVTMKRGDTSYLTPVMTSTMTWKGMPTTTVDSDAPKDRPPITKVQNRKYAAGSYRAASQIFAQINQDIDNITLVVGNKARVFIQETTPVGANEGDIWIISKLKSTFSDFAEGDSYSSVGGRWYDYYGSEMRVLKNGLWVPVMDSRKTELDSTRIEQDQRHISLMATSVDNGFAELRVEANRIRSEVIARDNSTRSYIEQTANQIRSEVVGALSGEFGDLFTEITQEVNSIRVSVGNKSNVFVQTTDPWDDSPRPEIKDGDIWIVDTLKRKFSDFATGESFSSVGFRWYDYYGADMKVRKGGVWHDFDSSKAVELNSTKITQTQNSINLVASGLTRGLSEMHVETDRIWSEIHSVDNQLRSRIEQTSEYIRTVVENDIEGVRSQIQQTADSITAEVESSINGLRSSINVQANRIGLLVQGTGSNAKIKPAAITAAINNSGDSSVVISADKIKIDGTAKIAGTLGVDTNGYMTYSGAHFYMNGALHLPTVAIAEGGAISMIVGTSPPVTHTINGAKFQNIITDLQVVPTGGGNYAIQKKTVGSPSDWTDAGTFSIAVSLTGSWNGGTLTVTGTKAGTVQTPYRRTVALLTDGVNTYNNFDVCVCDANSVTPIQNKLITKRIYLSGDAENGKVYARDGNASTGPILATLGLSTLLQAKSATANGTVTPDSGYAGLSDVSVNVTTGLTGTWNGGTLTVTGTKSGVVPNAYRRMVSLMTDGVNTYDNFDVCVCDANSTHPLLNKLLTKRIFLSGNADGRKVYARDGNATTGPILATLPLSSMLQSKSATANGTVTADSGYAGLNQVSVNVTTGLTGTWDAGTLTVTGVKSGVVPNAYSRSVSLLTDGVNTYNNFDVCVCDANAVTPIQNKLLTKRIYLSEDTGAGKVYARDGDATTGAILATLSETVYHSRCDLGNFTYVPSTSPFNPTGKTRLQNLQTLVSQHKNTPGYITFTGGVTGGSGQKKTYYFSIG